MAGKIMDALTGADRKRAEENYRTYKRESDMPVGEAMAGMEGAKQSLSGAMGNRSAVEAVDRAQRAAESEKKREASRAETMSAVNNKKGGKVCGMKKGGKVRGCGCAERGLTKGKMR